MSPLESSPPLLPQRPQPDVLLRLVASGVAVESAPSLSGSDDRQARHLVERTGKARGLDEGFDEHEGGTVLLGPPGLGKRRC